MSNARQLVPVIPYALGTVSAQQVTRLTIHNHAAAHDAIVRVLTGWGYRLISTAPSSIGGLETITAEAIDSAPGKNYGKDLQINLARAIEADWKQIQLTVQRSEQNPAHLADNEGA